MGAVNLSLRPGEFSRGMLRAMDAAEGRRKRRKRNTTPDRIGMDIKRDLLRGAAEADPEPDEFEGWLLERVLLAAEASGPVRALCMQILDEYQAAVMDPHFRQWLEEGAPSADAEA